MRIPDLPDDGAHLPGVPDDMERLWTPHRIAYIRGDAGAKPATSDAADCPFCLAPQRPDEEGLVVARGKYAYVVLNLFPYTSGHLLVCPYRHIAQCTETTLEEMTEMGELTKQAMATLKAQYNPGGFNIGMNQGPVAGAGIAAHLHQHVVPRWQGDANFLPIIGRTKAMPEFLADVQARLSKNWVKD